MINKNQSSTTKNSVIINGEIINMNKPPKTDLNNDTISEEDSFSSGLARTLAKAKKKAATKINKSPIFG